jgi:hypothetical protein
VRFVLTVSYVRAEYLQSSGPPVVSVGTKKKTLVDAYKNGGTDYRPEGRPDQVKVHDFIDTEFGKAFPYGAYDTVANNGWMNVGINHDTAEVAANMIRLARGVFRWGEPEIRHPRQLTLSLSPLPDLSHSQQHFFEGNALLKEPTRGKRIISK